MEPEKEGVGVGGINTSGSRVCAEELPAGVLDELLGTEAAEALGGILVD